jgi:hypothetical protein
MEYLFTVENTFLVAGRGLILTSGPGNKGIKVGNRIILISTNKAKIETKIRGIDFWENFSILIGEELQKKTYLLVLKFGIASKISLSKAFKTLPLRRFIKQSTIKTWQTFLNVY